MSRLQRPFLSDRYFFVTVRLSRIEKAHGTDPVPWPPARFDAGGEFIPDGSKFSDECKGSFGLGAITASGWLSG